MRTIISAIWFALVACAAFAVASQWLNPPPVKTMAYGHCKAEQEGRPCTFRQALLEDQKREVERAWRQ